jgi:hypothetical protein
MIDYFALGLTHALLLLGAWRMIQRADLDRDEPVGPAATAPEAEPKPVKPWLRTHA